MENFTQQTIASPIKPTWCPGCGNFAILAALRQAIEQLAIPQEKLAIFYGIGCSGNMADFNNVYGFHGLHGRAVASAIGAKLANHDLKIIVVGGDGDLYGEGLNHLIGAARGNHDITVLVHNNQMYSLTTGQSSPTTEQGTKTKSTPQGLIEQPLNPLVTALDTGASFVARAYVGQVMQFVEILKAAINHVGFSLVDILQPCPTFNKHNTYQWFASRVYDMAKEGYQAGDKTQAWQKMQPDQRIPLGIFYQDHRPAYHQQQICLKDQTLISRATQTRDLAAVLPLMS